MSAGQAGRRVAGIAAGRKKTMRRRGGARQAVGKKRDAANTAELRRLAQLVICGGAFVLLVAAKLLLPARMESLNQHLSGALERNMDVQAVFSAVGRMVSGTESSGIDEVYQAVFQPEEQGVPQKTSVASGITDSRNAMEHLRAFRPAEPEQTEEEDTVQPVEITTLAYVQYSEENLSENVSLEQAILGFEYCTPVNGDLSSDFGYREHPTEGEERFHYGIDLAADTGTAISCFADGTVTAVGESSSYGKYCMVAHESGYTTLYAHCSRVTVSSGKEVAEGEKIAEVGESGMATGPHLHFELQKDGCYLNPIYYVSVQ